MLARRILAWVNPVSYTHLRAHETREDLVCRLLLEKIEKLEQLRILENGFSIKVVETDLDSTGVDSLADIEIIEKQLALSPDN